MIGEWLVGTKTAWIVLFGTVSLWIWLPWMVIFCILIATDVVLWFLASIRLKETSSKRASLGIIYKTILLWVPIMLWLFLGYIKLEYGYDVLFVNSVLTTVLMGSELLSILAKFNTIYTGVRPKEEYDLAAQVFTFIPKIVKKYVNDFYNKFLNYKDE